MLPFATLLGWIGRAISAADGYRIESIHLRDPYVLPDPVSKTYYLYGTGWPVQDEEGPGFVAYRSSDLRRWEGPFVVFKRTPEFWADREYWAPEVHFYRGRYYLFGSFKAELAMRGTQILVADSPLGPFAPLWKRPVTPREWECLDGTLYLDPEGRPWIVFCHEWVQMYDGEMCALPLTPDLQLPAGVPRYLFTASQAPWVRPFYHEGKQGYVTDGPFLYTGSDGTLWMIWSSFSEGGYTVGVARSPSGDILGPWEQLPEPLFSDHGGHAMIFTAFDGTEYLILHQPNSGGPPVPTVFEFHEGAGRLELRRPERLLNP
ncbi:MAG: glycosyl hydrolase family 43 [Candidatus Poribacteria bacterium]|nr:MAG: glycosyl hydrolase family 43 [Candidatus Poribacteria bacterium]